MQQKIRNQFTDNSVIFTDHSGTCDNDLAITCDNDCAKGRVSRILSDPTITRRRIHNAAWRMQGEAIIWIVLARDRERDRERERETNFSPCERNSTKLCTPVSGATANSYRAGTLFPLSPFCPLFVDIEYLRSTSSVSPSARRYFCTFSTLCLFIFEWPFYFPCIRFRLSSIYILARLSSFEVTNLLFLFIYVFIWFIWFYCPIKIFISLFMPLLRSSKHSLTSFVHFRISFLFLQNKLLCALFWEIL